MPALKNQLHERFCELFPTLKLKGLSQGQIYLKAGGAAGTKHSADVLGSKLLKRPDVLARLSELAEPATKAAKIDAKNLLNKFEHVYEKAKDNPDTLGHANRAAELQGKLTGVMVEKHELSATFGFSSLNTVEELQAAIRMEFGDEAAAVILAIGDDKPRMPAFDVRTRWRSHMEFHARELLKLGTIEYAQDALEYVASGAAEPVEAVPHTHVDETAATMLALGRVPKERPRNR